MTPKRSSPQEQPLRPDDRPESEIDQKIKKLSDIFSLLGADYTQNVHLIVQQTCKVLDCICAVYSRLDNPLQPLICNASGQVLPCNISHDGSDKDYICCSVTRDAHNSPLIYEDLTQTPFAQTDPIIRQYGLKSYLGFPVNCKGETLGVLSVVDTQPRQFSNVDVYIISTLARTLALEEERKTVEKEQERLTSRLQQAQKMEAIATLAGGIAHQFNNALAVILGNIELIQMDGLADPRIFRFIDPINQAGQKMVQLTSQLLAYARGGKFQTQIVSTHRFVREALSLVGHTLSAQAELVMDLDENTDPIEVDSTQMQMLLAAILSNASEAMDKKGVVTVRLCNVDVGDEKDPRHHGLKPGRYVLLQIADTGKGMDETTRQRIFEPFFTTKFQGRGLGMAAVYGIVKKHGGYIYVDSSPGQGTTITVYLPGARLGPQIMGKQPAYGVHGVGTALIVEDEHLVMEVNRAIVEKLGYRVLEARSGREALHIARTFQGTIDFVLLDVILPDMGGNQIYPMLKEILPHIKVVVCSGFTLDGPAREIINAGAESFLPKPFTVAALSSTLDKILKIE
ncbi:MAG: response regulator [Desulfobacteraceae bacterium]|nr:response regulator [Desulfobacteraceae bacterium]